MKKKEINFENVGTEMPVVKLTLNNGVSFTAIIDTGSESTLIDKDFAKENKKEFELIKTRKKISLLGLNGEKDYPMLFVKALVSECDMKFQMIDFSYIGNNFEEKYGVKASALIGSDVLNQLNAVIDYDNHKVTFNKMNSK